MTWGLGCRAQRLAGYRLNDTLAQSYWITFSLLGQFDNLCGHDLSCQISAIN
jgi:hypothetical protein